MSEWTMGAYGALGGTLVSLLTFFQVVNSRQCWPWKVPGGINLPMYLAVEAARALIGAGVAWALAASGQLGIFGAIVAGAGAPAILDKWQSNASKVVRDGTLESPQEATANIPHPPTATRAVRSQAGGGA